MHHRQDDHLSTYYVCSEDSNSPTTTWLCGGGEESGCGPVARRNERERKRVRLVNMGFAKLRQYIPPVNGGRPGKRLSKVETLRSAIDYIRQLRQMLRQPPDPSPYYYPPPPLQDPYNRPCDFGCPCNEGSYPSSYEGSPHQDMMCLTYVHEPYLM